MARKCASTPTAGYTGVDKREEITEAREGRGDIRKDVKWHVAMPSAA
jgi:hypothetical protein